MHLLWMKIRVTSGITLFLMVTDRRHPALPFLGLYLVLDRSFSLFQMVCLKYIHHCSKKASSCTIWPNDALLPPKAPHSSPGPSLCNTPSLPGNSCPEGTAPAPQMQKDWLLTPVPRLCGNHQQSPQPAAAVSSPSPSPTALLQVLRLCRVSHGAPREQVSCRKGGGRKLTWKMLWRKKKNESDR